MSLPYYKRYPRDFLDKTIGMSLELKGAYGIVLDLIYMRDGRLPDDVQYVAGQLGCSVRKWKSIRDQLVAMGKLTVENGVISNSRADKVLEETRTFREKQAENRSHPNKNKAVETPKTHHTDTDTEVIVELSTRAREFRDRCFEAAGLDPQAAMAEPGLISTIALERLIRDPVSPCDPDLDVIPAIQSCAATLRKQGRTISNWSYCREASLRNRDQRLAGNPAPTAQPARPVHGPARQPKHAGGGIAAAAMRVAAQLRESRGQHDGPLGEPEPSPGHGLDPVFSNHRRITGTGG